MMAPVSAMSCALCVELALDLHYVGAGSLLPDKHRPAETIV